MSNVRCQMSGVRKGFSLVEVILASALFGLLMVGLVGSFLYGQENTALAGQRARATFLAEEGLEAVRNIRDEDFANLTDGTHGLSISSNQWTLSGSSDTTGIFTRQLTISSIDTNRKQVVSTINWQQNAQRTGEVELTTYLTNWQASVAEAASSLVVNTGAAITNLIDNTQVNGLTIENSGSSDITIDKIEVSWTGAPGGTKINEITIDGTSVWTGNRNSGSNLNISDFTLTSGSSYLINSLDFSSSMVGTTITLIFEMSDASTKEVIFSPGVSSDTTPPTAISDLSTANPTTNSVDLSWSAPGDDGSTGTATNYDIRYSTSTITELNWNLATTVTGEPTPSIAGSSESMTITGLSASTTYYFAIKTSDEALNISSISNVPSATTLGGGNEANSLIVNTASTLINPADNKQVIGITLSNSGLSTITVDQITLTWSGISGGAKSKEIQIGGTSVWTGNNTSGDLLNITDVAINSGAMVPINFILFSKNASGINLSITFTMSDTSTKTISNITP